MWHKIMKVLLILVSLALLTLGCILVVMYAGWQTLVGLALISEGRGLIRVIFRK